MVISILSCDENLELVKKELTVTPFIPFMKGNTSSFSFELFKLSKSKKSIIIPYFTKIQEQVKITPIINNELETIEEKKHDTPISLRSGDQLDCFNHIKNNSITNGIINLSTSTGKTVLSLKLIQHLKLKTLILVNKTELLNQWIDKIKQFLPNHSYGIIQGKNFDKNVDITIGMAQTLSMNETITLTDLKSYSITIIDEIHSIATKVFSKVFFKITSKYQFGLTATVNRNDNLDVVFKYFLGDIIYSNVDKNSALKQESIVKVYKLDIDIGEIKYIHFMGEKKINLSNLLNKVADSNERNDRIIDIINELIKENPERKILCMSDRINCLKYINSKLSISKLFIGKMTKDELLESRKSQVILATYSMVVQGFDQPDINTLLFITPRSNIEQAIGRIYRQNHNITPNIIDIIDKNYPIFYAQYSKRLKIYKTKINNVIIQHYD